MRILAQPRAIVRAYQRRPSLRRKRAGLALSSVWPFWLIVGFVVAVLVSAGWYSSITLRRTPSQTDGDQLVVKARDAKDFNLPSGDHKMRNTNLIASTFLVLVVATGATWKSKETF